jgi:transposase
VKSDDCLYIGIDFSKDRNDIALLPSDGPPITKHKAFPNSYTGYLDIKEWLLKSLAEYNPSQIQIGGEATSYYWLPLFSQFFTDPDWQPYHPDVYLLNATQVHWFKKSKPPNSKTDLIDPAEIGDFLRERDSVVWAYSPKWLALRFYTRLRMHLVNSRTREKNLLNLYLFLLHSTYTSQKPFADYLGYTSQELLTHPEVLESMSSLPLDELAEKLDEISKHTLPDPSNNASKLQQVLADTFPQDPILVSAYNNIVSILIKTINSLKERITEVEAIITTLVSSGEYPEIDRLKTIPGVGFVLASGLAAEIGDISRFTQLPIYDEKLEVWRLRHNREVLSAIAKYAGLWWPENSSGKFKADDLHMSAKGNPYLRYYVLEAADIMRQRIPTYRDYYSKKYDQATINKHKRALVLTGSQCLDLFVSLLRRKEIYRQREVKSS